ncbi:amidohydrolase family protein [Kribbella sp. NBC_01510]|uniref:amidohydrolase family protein n=1 Tax=Kribbella sp. NBC_01510 TaxID=2903581 RepID=UPI00386C3D34
MRIDAHQHFWDPARHEYPWMAGDAMDPVRRAFTPDDLRPVLRAAEIDGTILVQTVSSVAETREFLQLAAATDFIAGVVGWVDLTSAAVGDHLDELLDGPGGSRLVGIRHQVHDEADPEWLGRDDVRRGLAAVQQRGLTYDLLVRARELPAAVDVVRALPDLPFVLDHVAKPRIAAGADPEWTERMPALAAAPNVAVKLSGMVTEANWGTWTAADLRPFVERVVRWFGAERLLFGSDWPVCLLAGSYGDIVTGLDAALPAMSPSERVLLYGGNAEQVYRRSRAAG